MLRLVPKLTAAPEPGRAERFTSEIGALVTESLIVEPWIWPRFGLVGPSDPGAHQDMRYADLVISARALEPFFANSARLGLSLPCADRDAALLWRHTGVTAEAAMYRATGGINTHKGAIFLLGLLAFSWGRLVRCHGAAMHAWPASRQRRAVFDMAFRCLAWRLREEQQRDRRTLSETYGQWAQRRFQWGGMRHTVVTGFIGLRTALHCCGQARGVSPRVSLAVVRHWLLVSCQDSNLVKRAGWRGAQRALCEAREALRAGSVLTPCGLSRLYKLDREMCERGWSASGVGDLLAAYLFVDSLTRGHVMPGLTSSPGALWPG